MKEEKKELENFENFKLFLEKIGNTNLKDGKGEDFNLKLAKLILLFVENKAYDSFAFEKTLKKEEVGKYLKIISRFLRVMDRPLFNFLKKWRN